jgi:rhomboid protease GluP
MPRCLKCGAELQVNEEGIAPVLCDRCAGIATRRARISLNTGTLRQYPATTALLGINVAVFLAMVLSGGFSGLFGHFDPRLTIAWGSNFSFYTFAGQYWRLVTAGFVHAGILHIAFNMWCLWYVGQISERLFGRWITVAVYLLTGVGGSLLSLWVHPVVNEVGASGAIFGIAGALLTGIKFGNVSIPAWQRRSLFSSLIFFVGFNLVLGGAIPGIDNWCHLGGLITGMIFGVPLATASASGKKSLEWATIILSALVLAGIGARVVQVGRAQLGLIGEHTAPLNLPAPRPAPDHAVGLSIPSASAPGGTNRKL